MVKTRSTPSATTPIAGAGGNVHPAWYTYFQSLNQVVTPAPTPSPVPGGGGLPVPSVTNIAVLRALTSQASQVWVEGFYLPGDGGGGPFNTGAAAPDNGGTIIQSAVSTYYRETGGQPYSVKWFGAKGNGVFNDLPAIQATLNQHKSCFFPPGTYHITGAITITSDGQTVFGINSASTVITTDHATADIFTITGQFCELYGLSMTASVVRTGGAFINANFCNYSHFHDFTMTAFWRGIVIQGASNLTGIHIDNARIMLGVSGTSEGIVILSGVDLILQNLWIVGAPGQNLMTGVHVSNCGDLTLDHVSTVFAGNGLTIDPGSGEATQVIFVSDCFFDSGSGAGIIIQPSNGGQVQATQIINTWVATNAGGGVILNAASGAAILQTSIVDCILSNNTGIGVHFVTASVTHTNIAGCTISGNTTYGIFIEASLTKFTIIDNIIGASGEFVGNTLYGLIILAGTDDFNISNNTMLGNGSGSINMFGASPPYGTSAFGTTCFITKNIGFITQNSSVLVTAGGTATYTVPHGLAKAPFVQDISLTPASGLGFASSFYVTNATGGGFDVVFNVDPGPGVDIAWQARTLGS